MPRAFRGIFLNFISVNRYWLFVELKFRGVAVTAPATVMSFTEASGSYQAVAVRAFSHFRPSNKQSLANK